MVLPAAARRVLVCLSFRACRLPADRLTGVTVSSAAGIVVAVGKGFSVNSITGILQGAADLVFTSLKADSLKLVNSGYGRLLCTVTDMALKISFQPSCIERRTVQAKTCSIKHGPVCCLLSPSTPATSGSCNLHCTGTQIHIAGPGCRPACLLAGTSHPHAVCERKFH